MGLIERLTTDASSLAGALRTLRMTTPIAKHPTRVFPRRHRGAGRQVRRRAGAALRPRDASPIASSSRAPTATRAGRWRRASRKGDTVCLLMPNRPEFLALWLGVTRVGGVVALLNTNLTGTCARPLHQRGRARSTSSSRPNCSRAFETRAAAPHRRCRALAARRCAAARRSAAHRPRDREALRRPASRQRTAPAHHRGPRALHLHVRHDRPAQGRQHESLPDDARVPRLRRRHGHARDRPHV